MSHPSHDEPRPESYHLQLNSFRRYSGRSFMRLSIYLPSPTVQSLARATNTQGRGGAGILEAPGPDPLFSQDSIKVSGSFLYAVNVSTTLPLSYIRLIVSRPVRTPSPCSRSTLMTLLSSEWLEVPSAQAASFQSQSRRLKRGTWSAC